MTGTPCLHAVVVTFHPEAARLGPLVTALLRQVAVVHIVDNTPTGGDDLGDFARGPRVVVLAQGRNRGVATALNIGMASAFAEGASHVLLSDQDSLPLPGMVARLLATANEYEAVGQRVAVVGPDFINEIDDRSFRFEVFRRHWPVYCHERPSTAHPVLDAAAIISSGSLISRQSFDAVGPMSDRLFIDFVDVEWCERARAKGFRCLADGRALMQHRMGDDRLRFWLFGWRTVARYGRVRLYYQARNAAYLATRAGVNWRFRTGAIWFLARKLYAYAVGSRPGDGTLTALLRGLAAGLRGRLGVDS